MYGSLKEFTECYGGWLRGDYVPYRDAIAAWTEANREALASAGIEAPPSLSTPPKHPFDYILDVKPAAPDPAPGS